MKRFVFLFITVIVILAILLFIFNPGILEKIWLWIIGLIGPIVLAFKTGIDWIKQLFTKTDTEQSKEAGPIQNLTSPNHTVISENQAIVTPDLNDLDKSKLLSRIKELEDQLQLTIDDSFDGITLTLLRYFDDGESTLGLLFYNEKFFCYTLEDTFREIKVKDETRIPAGDYRVGLNRADTRKTVAYRIKRDWFDYHLHIKDVPGFSGIYIHIGYHHKHTSGCILIADGIGVNNPQLMITHSEEAYERLYKKLRAVLRHDQKVRIQIKDEVWLAHSFLKKKSLIIN